MLTRLLLRLVSLGAKFALTLAIVRWLGDTALADYGVAVAAAVVASKLLGLGFSVEINRRLASMPQTAIKQAFGLAWVYGAAYVAVCALAAWLSVVDALRWPGGWSTVTIAAMGAVVLSEHQAFEVNGYLFALHQHRVASRMLFARTGLWAALAIFGVWSGVIAHLNGVLMLWLGANLCAIGWGWRAIRGVHAEIVAVSEQHRAQPPPFGEMWRAGVGFYVATVLLSVTQYAERFFAAHALDAGAVGHYVFLWAMANAVQTLSQAALASTATPAMARTASQAPGDMAALIRTQTLKALAMTLLVAASFWWLLGPLLMLVNKRISVADSFVFGVLLLSFVLRSAGDILWGAAIALGMQGAVLAGLAGIAMVGLPAAYVLIGRYGVPGAAASHAMLSVMVTGWLWLAVWRRARSTASQAAPAAGAMQ